MNPSLPRLQSQSLIPNHLLQANILPYNLLQDIPEPLILDKRLVIEGDVRGVEGGYKVDCGTVGNVSFCVWGMGEGKTAHGQRRAREKENVLLGRVEEGVEVV